MAVLLAHEQLTAAQRKLRLEIENRRLIERRVSVWNGAEHRRRPTKPVGCGAEVACHLGGLAWLAPVDYDARHTGALRPACKHVQREVVKRRADPAVGDEHDVDAQVGRDTRVVPAKDRADPTMASALDDHEAVVALQALECMLHARPDRFVGQGRRLVVKEAFRLTPRDYNGRHVVDGILHAKECMGDRGILVDANLHARFV